MASSKINNLEDCFDLLADADASKTFPKQSSSLRKGDFVILKGKVCQIVEMMVSKPGKHGHCKVRLTGLEIFTNKRYEDFCPGAQNVEVPFVTRKEYQLVAISYDGYITLMDMETYKIRSDMKLPEGDIGKRLKDAFQKDEAQVLCNVLSAMNEEKIISFKSVSVDKM